MKKLIGLMACIMLLGLSSAFAQSKTVTGTVIDQAGLGIPGVSVSIKGTNEGAYTDIDGKWMLEVTSKDVLVISFVGMKSQEIKVGDKKVINVTLEEDRVAVDEVVVTGYGTKKRNEFTGSVTTVGKEVLEQVPMPSVEQVLQGNVAGLSSVSTTGQPGAAQDIKIRGVGSISASNAPLYVIDGVPVVSGDYSRISTSANVMAGISSNDIESINVLKDASATSVYGARGANGVIVITTKRGKQGKTTFSFDAEYGFNNIAVDEQKALSTSQWEELLYESLENSDYAGYIAQFGSARKLWVDGFGQPDWDSNVNTNWTDVVLRSTAVQQQYNFTMKGGNNKTNFFTSIGYFDQEGVVKNSDFDRISGLINLNHRATDKVTVQTSLNISHSKQHTLSDGGTFANPMLSRFFCLSADSPYNEDGSVYSGGRMMNGLFNPAYLLENDFKENMTTKLLGNAQLFYRPIENLKYTCKIGVDYLNIEENEYQNRTHGDGYSVMGRAYGYYTRNFNWVFQNMLDYHFDLDDDNKFDFKLLYEAQKNKLYNLSAMAERVAASNLFYLNTYAAPRTASSGFGTWASASSMINVNYAYRGRLFVDGTYRREGSSRFSPDNKYGNFWSVGASYLLSEEDFIKSVPFINELKVRSSYGVNGNAGIASNLYLARVAYTGAYNDFPATFITGIENNDLKWEKNTPFNVGVDFKLFDTRLSGTLEYFHRTTSDLLLAVPITRTSGNTAITKNVGEMVNKGYEITLSSDNIRGDFSWTTDFNITFIKNEVTKLYKDSAGEDVEIKTTATLIREGEDINTWYMKEWAGVDPANGDPLWYDKDGNKTNDYSKAAQTVQGTSTPDYYGGLTNTFSYKGFSLSAQLNYSFGYKIADSWANYLMSDGNYTASYGGYAELYDRWQKEGDIAKNPKNNYTNKSKSNEMSTRFLYDGDHIRLRNVTLGYNIPEQWLNRTGIKALNVYVRGTNLYTYKFDKDLNFDPEVGTDGWIDLTLPIMKTVTFGVKLNF